MSTKETGHSRQMDKALFDFYGKPSFGQVMPLAIQHVLAMIVGCNPIHHCCRCSRTFPEGFRYSDPGCSGNVSTYHVITVISLYKNQVVRHRCRTSGYDGYQFCLRAKYAGNRRRV